MAMLSFVEHATNVLFQD